MPATPGTLTQSQIRGLWTPRCPTFWETEPSTGGESHGHGELGAHLPLEGGGQTSTRAGPGNYLLSSGEGRGMLTPRAPQSRTGHGGQRVEAGEPREEGGHSQAAPWWLVTEPQGPSSPPSSSTCCRGRRTMPSRPPELGRQPPPLGCKGPWGHLGTGLQTAARSGLHPYLHTLTHLCMGTLTCTLTPTFTHAHTSPCRPMCTHTHAHPHVPHRHTDTHSGTWPPLPCEMASPHLESMSPTPSPGPAHTGAPRPPQASPQDAREATPDARPSPLSLCFLS